MTGSAQTAISLPKGEGAIRGIRDTFQTDLHTGTGNYSIPIQLPPGRSGLQPSLTLGYSTGNPNGLFGLGWARQVPGVRRRTSHGVPCDDGSDVFVLSGAEDLVPVPGGSASEQPYRRRVKGLFARIVHHRGAGQDCSSCRGRSGVPPESALPTAASSSPTWTVSAAPQPAWHAPAMPSRHRSEGGVLGGCSDAARANLTKEVAP